MLLNIIVPVGNADYKLNSITYAKFAKPISSSLIRIKL